MRDPIEVGQNRLDLVTAQDDGKLYRSLGGNQVVEPRQGWGEGRMALGVEEEDEALGPRDVCILRSPAVVPGAHRLAHAIKELGLLLGGGVAHVVHHHDPPEWPHPMPTYDSSSISARGRNALAQAAVPPPTRSGSPG